ncbi:MAG TPA: MqnA/MqnD/SBP family protein [Planctomycetota bacterium]|nr:MqnA/MqnD/SBP family protein [Planctomycetota bacterium]
MPQTQNQQAGWKPALRTRTIRAAFTSDPDDAYAWWALATGKLEVPGCRFETSAHHIQDINEACVRGEYDIAAVSSAAWPKLAGNYCILQSGASVGRNYGPALATKRLEESEIARGARVGIPGEMTTGALLLRLFYPGVKTVALRFDEIAGAILEDKIDAGVLIHEELLNWKAAGLRRVACLGEKWTAHTGLPLTVGLNVIHRRLGSDLMAELSRAIRESMLLADAHEAEALKWAMRYSREAEPEIGRTFIRMFANADTVRMGDDCLRALKTMFDMAHERGLCDAVPEIAVI